MARPAKDLSHFGIFNIEHLLKKIENAEDTSYLVDGLIAEHSLNLLAGHSALGKTPLAVTLGIAVASGTPFLEHSTRQGRVLYCDSESPMAQFAAMTGQIARQAELDAIPEGFQVWSPNWDDNAGLDYGDALLQRVRVAEPDLVIVDPLRNFFPEVEAAADDAARRFNQIEALAKERGTSYVFVHHLRKTNAETPSVVDDPHGWMLNVAGSQAIVNRVNARLGVEQFGADDIVIGGMIRGMGPIPPIHVTRDYDEENEIRGYRRQNELDTLREDYRSALAQLPIDFSHSDITAVLGGSGTSKNARFIGTLTSLRLIEKSGDKRYRKLVNQGVKGALRLVA
jgi:hypothetical protein